jgi:hypothetical protein
LSYKEPTTERYYHGAISGTDATNLLLDKAKPGSYLVRESRSDPQNYVLCVRCENNKIVHLIITYMVCLHPHHHHQYSNFSLIYRKMVIQCKIVVNVIQH